LKNNKLNVVFGPRDSCPKVVVRDLILADTPGDEPVL